MFGQTKTKPANTKPAQSSKTVWLTAAAGLTAFAMFSGSAMAQNKGYFAGFDGNWAGDGRLELESGATERIRCRAKNSVKKNGDGLIQVLRCAGDSYKLSFNSDLTFKKDAGVVTGTWREKNYNVGGFIMGPARPGVVRASVDHEDFSAKVSVVTKGKKQTVTIRPQGLDVRIVSVTLTRR